MQHWATTQPVLNSLDSATRSTNYTMSDTATVTRFNPYAQRNTGVNLLGLDEDNKADEDSLSDTNSFTSSDPKVIPISITREILQTTVEVMTEDPNLTFQPKCIVCLVTNQEKTDHCFNKCKTLQNHEQLKDELFERVKKS